MQQQSQPFTASVKKVAKKSVKKTDTKKTTKPTKSTKKVYNNSMENSGKAY